MVEMLDTLIALVLFGAGYWIGRRRTVRMPELPGTEEQEQFRLQEDRTAFAQLMGYSAERAYGIHDQE